MVGKKAEQRRWTIDIQAKAKNFDFKVEASNYLPTYYNFLRFSLFLKISRLLIRVNSDDNRTTKRRSLKSRIVGAIKKFRNRTTKRKAFAAHKPSRIKRSKWVSCKSIYKDTKGIIIHSLSILLKIFFILAIVGYPLWLNMKNHLSYNEPTFASRYFQKACTWAASQVLQMFGSYFFSL